VNDDDINSYHVHVTVKLGIKPEPFESNSSKDPWMLKYFHATAELPFLHSQCYPY